MNNCLLFSYEILSDVYKNGAYLSVTLPRFLSTLDNKDRKIVTRTVYGVIERHEEFSYVLRSLCKKMPRPSIRIILRIGFYLAKYSDGMPDYAVVNEIVNLTKGIKKEQAGFVNATLKAYIKNKDIKPCNKLDLLSYETNRPIWLISSLIRDYGEEKGIELCRRNYKNNHLRISGDLKEADFLKEFNKDNSLVRTEYGFLVKSTDRFSELIKQGKATMMALDSMKICRVLTPEPTATEILDMCSAPGGKSVYLSEINPEAHIISLELHEHRAELVKSYAKRMNRSNISVRVADSTVINNEYIDRFDYCLVDAPCSGVGVIPSNPDIVLNRTEESIKELTAVQAKLLDTASRYIKKGGILVYSTCSNLCAENNGIIREFLKKHREFALDYSEELCDCIKTFENDDKGNDGFFVARMKRIK